MKIKDRSVFGQGILAAKMGNPKESNPYKTSPRDEWWNLGYDAYVGDKFGDMKKHKLYEGTV